MIVPIEVIADAEVKHYISADGVIHVTSILVKHKGSITNLLPMLELIDEEGYLTEAIKDQLINGHNDVLSKFKAK